MTANLRIIANNIGDAATLTSSSTQNLLLRSQEFDNASWGGTATHTANSTAAPDGTMTADTITDGSAVVTQSKTQTVTIPNDSEAYTFVVMTPNTGFGAPVPWLCIKLSLTGGGTPVSGGYLLNTQFGTSQTLGPGVGGVDTLGDGSSATPWYALYVTVTNNGTGNTSAVLEISPAFSASASGTPYVADVTQTGSKAVWGASLTKSAARTGYVPTTSAAATGGNFSTTLPVTNLQLEGKSRVARTTDAYGDKIINGNLSASDTLSAMVLYNHNISRAAKIRLQLYSAANQGGSVLYDSGLVSPILSISWVGWGAGASSPAAFLPLWFAAVAAVLSFRLTITEDPTTAPSYVQIKRLLLGRYFEPAVNVALGLSLAWNDSSVQRRTQGGSIRTETRALYRSLSGVLDCLTETERYQFLDAVRAAGLRKEVFVSAFPAVGGIKERDFSMLGKFTRLPPIDVVQATTYSSGFEIEEV